MICVARRSEPLDNSEGEERNVITLGAVLAVGLILSGIVVPSAVKAGDLVCNGVGHLRLAGILVPSGAICFLDGTQVEGNVRVDRGGTLLTAGATIRGNIHSDRALRIQLVGTRVLGNVTLVRSAEHVAVGDCTGPNHSPGRGAIIEGNIQLSKNYAWSGVCGASIRGNLQASGNSGMVLVAGNDIDGNLHAGQNLNALTITFNAIKGNLRCDENVFPPRAYGNRVGGNREGECAGR